MVKRLLGVLLLAGGACLPVGAQQLLSLDSCRAMALRNNKQLSISKLKQDIAANLRRSARTKYLPHISAIGTYEYTSKEISILNNNQKDNLSSIGTNAQSLLSNGVQAVSGDLQGIGNTLIQLGASPADVSALLNQVGSQLQGGVSGVGTFLNTEGQKIVDAFRTDTRSIWAGSVMAVQPLFLGGSIVALNRLADLNEQLAANSANARQQLILYNTDQAYWQVVSLKHKKQLAESYLNLVKKLDSDVQKMISEGVATRSEGLSVSVKVSEAEITVQKVNDGLTLARMLLCQEIGLPTNESIVLVDEAADNLEVTPLVPHADVEQAVERRPEVKMLETAVDMSRQTTNILKAGNLPQVALTGGYAVSNPNVLNGFEKKFGGLWNVGVLVRVPIWNWGDVTYKVRAAKGATAIANLELAEAREKIELQVNQTSFQADEANKRLALAETSIKRAEENLRTANLGFSEGVISPTVVMEAQTAWLQAKSQKIDAQIDVLLSLVNLQKAQGTLSVAK